MRFRTNVIINMDDGDGHFDAPQPKPQIHKVLYALCSIAIASFLVREYRQTGLWNSGNFGFFNEILFWRRWDGDTEPCPTFTVCSESFWNFFFFCSSKPKTSDYEYRRTKELHICVFPVGHSRKFTPWERYDHKSITMMLVRVHRTLTRVPSRHKSLHEST